MTATSPTALRPENGSATDRWATRLVCSWIGPEAEGGTAPLDEPAFLSPAGKPWLVEYDLAGRDGRAWAASLAGRPWTLWRYRELLPTLEPGAVDLGEGGTPLVPLRRLAPEGVEVLIKEEGGNPTGSFKARGLSLAIHRARELGAPGVELASAGNAALALTAYAAAAGLPARLALPEDTPERIARRCREHGAEVLVTGKNLVESGKALAALAPSGGREYWNLSTLKEPYRVEGKKTMGLELAEQLGWTLPDWIVYPTGGGTGIVGMHKAFDELERLGLLDARAGKRPRFVVVQTAGCAPMVRAFEAGETAATPWESPRRTRAWGLRVPQAIGDFLILRALRETDGRAVAVEEETLAPMEERVLREEGMRFSPEGAACLVALERLAAEGTVAPGEKVVVFQTGSPDNY